MDSNFWAIQYYSNWPDFAYRFPNIFVTELVPKFHHILNQIWGKNEEV